MNAHEAAAASPNINTHPHAACGASAQQNDGRARDNTCDPKVSREGQGDTEPQRLRGGRGAGFEDSWHVAGDLGKSAEAGGPRRFDPWVRGVWLVNRRVTHSLPLGGVIWGISLLFWGGKGGGGEGEGSRGEGLGGGGTS